MSRAAANTSAADRAAPQLCKPARSLSLRGQLRSEQRHAIIRHSCSRQASGHTRDLIHYRTAASRMTHRRVFRPEVAAFRLLLRTAYCVCGCGRTIAGLSTTHRLRGPSSASHRVPQTERHRRFCFNCASPTSAPRHVLSPTLDCLQRRSSRSSKFNNDARRDQCFRSTQFTVSLNS